MSKRPKRAPKNREPPPSEATGLVRLLSEYPVATLDLHGYKADQARARVQSFLSTQARISGGQVVHVITGKGSGSEGVAVLWGLVRDMLTTDKAGLVEEYGGMLGGGGWVVRLAQRSP